jgi:hypothetical protein
MELTMSFKPEVIADASGQWSSNACRFETEAEAEAYAHDLFMRWTLVRETRVVQCNDPVVCRFVNGATEWIKDPVQ